MSTLRLSILEESGNILFCLFLQVISLRRRFEALAVNDGQSRLVVLLLGDPHGLKGGERGQHGAADPL